MGAANCIDYSAYGTRNCHCCTVGKSSRPVVKADELQCAVRCISCRKIGAHSCRTRTEGSAILHSATAVLVGPTNGNKEKIALDKLE